MATQHQPGIFSSFVSEYDRRTLSQASFFVPSLQPGMRLLDVGCGSGTITVELASVVAPAPLVGIDLSEPRIEAARRNAQERGIENLEFKVGDLCHLPFDDNEFDAVFEHMVFMHMPDPEGGVREVLRVLKPGGVFGGRDVDRNSFFANWPLLLDVFLELLFKYRSVRGANDAVGKMVPGMLRTAGFINIEVTTSSDTFGTLERRKDLREQYLGMATEPDFLPTVVPKGWADAESVQRMIEAFERWVEEPGAFHARGSVGSVAFKPTAGS